MKNIWLFYISIQSVNFEEWYLKNIINVVMNKNHISLRGLVITTVLMKFFRIQQNSHYLFRILHVKMDYTTETLDTKV